MRFLFILLVGFSGQAFANSEFNQEVLFHELLPNMSYYLEYFRQSGQLTSSLTDVEQRQLNLIAANLIDYPPSLNFQAPRADFTLNAGEPERVAKTTSYQPDPIDINSGMLNDRAIELDIPLAIQLLIHELGHKLGQDKDQAAVDSLATKVSTFFQAFTQTVRVSPEWKVHVLSLPIRWFYWPQPRPWYNWTYRLRPNSAIFLENSATGFTSFTAQVDDVLEGAGGTYYGTRVAGDAFTDHQIYLYAADAANGEVKLTARQDKRLQPLNPARIKYEQDLFEKSIRKEESLSLRLQPDHKSFHPSVRPSLDQSVVEPVATKL
jgi:hypothetical protein